MGNRKIGKKPENGNKPGPGCPITFPFSHFPNNLQQKNKKVQWIPTCGKMTYNQFPKNLQNGKAKLNKFPLWETKF